MRPGTFPTRGMRNSQAVEDQQNRDLAEALDQLHGQQPADEITSPPRLMSSKLYVSAREAVQATDPQIDPAIAAALENPTVRNLLQQASQEIEQQKAAFIQATNGAAAEVTAAMLVSFPEFSHVKNAGELAAAATVLAQQNPQRFQQFRNFYNRTQTVLQQQQQVAAQTAAAAKRTRTRTVPAIRDLARRTFAGQRNPGKSESKFGPRSLRTRGRRGSRKQIWCKPGIPLLRLGIALFKI